MTVFFKSLENCSAAIISTYHKQKLECTQNLLQYTLHFMKILENSGAEIVIASVNSPIALYVGNHCTLCLKLFKVLIGMKKENMKIENRI